MFHTGSWFDELALVLRQTTESGFVESFGGNWKIEFFLKTHGTERRRVEDSVGKVFGFVQKRKIVDYNSSSSFGNLKTTGEIGREPFC